VRYVLREPRLQMEVQMVVIGTITRTAVSMTALGKTVAEVELRSPAGGTLDKVVATFSLEWAPMLDDLDGSVVSMEVRTLSLTEPGEYEADGVSLVARQLLQIC
jgi:hypothetical protein